VEAVARSDRGGAPAVLHARLQARGDALGPLRVRHAAGELLGLPGARRRTRRAQVLVSGHPAWLALTKRQRTVFTDLQYYDWARPMDIGARDQSWHSAVLNQLVRKGLVERTHRGSDRSFLYRLTDAGRNLQREIEIETA